MEKTKIIGVEGRVAFIAPRGGRRVPHDRPIKVELTEWIRRRLFDGDIALFEEPKAKIQVISKIEKNTPEKLKEST